MSLIYNKIKPFPKAFHNLTGISVSLFDSLIEKLRPLWKESITDAYKKEGRPYNHGIEEHLLMLLLYYRNYITQRFLGFLFDIDHSRICRIIKNIELLLAPITTIPKTRHRGQKELESLIIDATKQRIERPCQNQKPYYSGKKKAHTIKTEIRITREGEIVHVSSSYAGSVHDFEVYKNEPPAKDGLHLFVDLGYQGINQLHNGSVEIPYKKSKKNPLDEESKEYNHALAKIRVKVENVIRCLKIFRILSDRYRNKRKGYKEKFSIIAGIVNMKNGFV